MLVASFFCAILSAFLGHNCSVCMMQAYYFEYVLTKSSVCPMLFYLYLLKLKNVELK